MLGNRELRLLRYFSMSNHAFSSQDILKDLEITERQLSYSLAKINDELEQAGSLGIKRQRDGTFHFNLDNVQWLYYQKSNLLVSQDRRGDFYLQPSYRPLFLYLFLIAHSKKVSRTQIQDFLGVSKNTVIQDIKNTSKKIHSEKLLLSYHQSKGYAIEGDYDDKRRLLISYINHLVIEEVNISLLEELFAHQKSKLLKLISSFERHFSLRFSDSSFTKLYFTFGVYEQFVINQQRTKTDKLTYLSPLRQEDEFCFVRHICQELDLSFASDIDLEWVTLLFLSSNTISNETVSENHYLYKVVSDMVNIFETKSGIYFKEKELLTKKLFFHLKPAVYRLRYKVPLSDSEYYKISDSDLHNQTIYSILTTCLQPLETYLGMDIPKSEVELISYYFGSELVKISEKYEEMSHFRTGVVCSNGMVAAKIMVQTLSALFPELTFVTTCSRRDFPQYAQEFDLVFTTAPLDTEIPYYVIPSVINQEEQKKLRQRVLTDLKIDNFDQKTKKILEMIKQYADIRDVYELGNALEELISNDHPITSGATDKLLADYLEPSRLLTTSKAINWKQGLRLIGEILIEQGFITENYLNLVIKQMRQEDSYYILGESVAIPHASPEDGVLQEACAVLVSKQPIIFPKDRPVHFIVLLALLDNKNHLGALNQIMHLSRSPDLQQELLSQIEQPSLYTSLVTIPKKS
ncbi:transcriptional antiterminator/mannitol/fructose-specific phosphotransferase system IIA component (Ntr-type) [Streptococcus rupicaprae]|uniref:Ascorbate-specific PTS system EIIA component n=1 Tax=Streptococcus rupicaprae TaxID=759619 RepID=A0ABV2FK98_9STRE